MDLPYKGVSSATYSCSRRDRRKSETPQRRPAPHSACIGRPRDRVAACSGTGSPHTTQSPRCRFVSERGGLAEYSSAWSPRRIVTRTHSHRETSTRTLLRVPYRCRGMRRLHRRRPEAEDRPGEKTGRVGWPWSGLVAFSEREHAVPDLSHRANRRKYAPASPGRGRDAG